MRTTIAAGFADQAPTKLVVAAFDDLGEGLRWALNTIVTVTGSLSGLQFLSDTLHTECAIGFGSFGFAQASGRGL